MKLFPVWLLTLFALLTLGSPEALGQQLPPAGQPLQIIKGFGHMQSPVKGPSGRVYFLSSVSGSQNVLLLYALETNTFSQAWSSELARGETALGSPAVAPDGTIYIGTISAGTAGENYLRAYRDQGNQAGLKWLITMPFIDGASSGINGIPAIGVDGTIYVTDIGGNLHAIEDRGTNGFLRWSYTPPGARSAPVSPAIGADGTIYFGTVNRAGSSVVNFHAVRDNRTNGTPVWSVGLSGEISGSPVIGADGAVYVGTFDVESLGLLGRLYAINPNGTFKWIEPFRSPGIIDSPAILGTNGLIYVATRGSTNQALYALQDLGSNFSNRWRFPEDKDRRQLGIKDILVSPVLGADGTVYFGDQVNSIYAVKDQGTSGSLSWRLTNAPNFSIRSSPLLTTANQGFEIPVLLIGSEDENMYAIVASSSLATNAPWPMVSQNPAHTGRVPNTAPVISTIGAQTVPEDQLLNLSFTIRDIETAPSNLVVTATSSQSLLVAPSGLVTGGTGTNRTLRITPVLNASGTNTITVTVRDGGGLTSSTSFLLTVTPVNDPPTIVEPAPIILDEDTPATVIITINDVDSPASSLRLTAEGTDDLLPTTGLSVTGASNNRTLRITPATNDFGSASILLTLTDGASAPVTLLVPVTVKPLPDPPRINPIPTQPTNEDTPINVQVTVSDVDTDPLLIRLTATSSNPSLIPNGTGIGFSGSGATRILSLIPAPNAPLAGASDQAVITVFAEDDRTNIVSTQFILVVLPVNDAPQISPIGNIQVVEGAAATNTFVVSDIDTPIANLTVTATSTNTTLVRPTGIAVFGNGANRTVVIQPEPGQAGRTEITLTVSDGALSTPTRFLLSVGATNRPPEISPNPIANITIAEDTRSQPVLFTVADREGAAVGVRVNSSDPTLIPNSEENLQLTSSGTSQSLVILPARDRTGTATITITASDETSSSTRSFLVTVTPENDPPTGARGLATTQEDRSVQVTLEAFDIDSPANALRFVTFQGKEARGTLSTNTLPAFLTYTPAPNFSGTDQFFYQVTDGLTNSPLYAVSVIVTPSNDLPTISIIPDQRINQDTSITLPFNASDVETFPPTLTAESSNQVLIPASSLTLGGTGTNRTLTIQPPPGRNGITFITVSAIDADGGRASTTFELTVNGIPSLTPIPDVVVVQGDPRATRSVFAIDVETSPENLTVEYTLGNPDLFDPLFPIFERPGTPPSVKDLIFIPRKDTATGLEIIGTSTIELRVLDGMGGAVTNTFTFTVNPRSVPPAFSFQPQDQTNRVGTVANFFSFLSQGTAPLAYQWFFNGTTLPAETNLTLSIPNLTPAQEGNYFLVVTNQAGSVTSRVARLTVLLPPSFVSHPTSATLPTNARLELGVDVQGTPPFAFQWLRGPTPIPGATNRTLLIPNVATNDSGTYRVVVTGPGGALTSSNAIVQVLVPPLIIAQPLSQSAFVGSNVIFSVVAGGDAPLGYQWRLNGLPIPAATNATVLVNVTNDAQAGEYSVVVTNLVGFVTSSNALLTLQGPPAISRQPTSQRIPEGSSATLEVVATGSAPLSYQWSFNGTAVANATNSTLVLSNIQSNQAGPYTVTVSNPAGSVTSTPATLEVLLRPRIVTPPASVTAIAGSDVRLQVTASGTAPLSYLWSFGGVPIPGASGPELLLSQIQTNQAGSYSVTVTNDAGAITSTPAVVSVLTPPQILTQPLSLTTKAGSNATFTVVATGSEPLVYQWRFGTNALRNATNTTLQLVSLTPENAGAYSVVITNAAGSATSSEAVLTVVVDNPPPTVAIIQPTPGAQFTAPANLTIEARADDEDGLVTRVDFLVNDVKAGEDSSSPFSLGLEQLPPGEYRLVARAIDNQGASTLSSPVSITVTPPNNLPVIGITDNALTEGDSGTTPLEFVLTLSAPSTVPVTVRFATSEGSALPGADYIATNGIVEFLPGETSKTVTVEIVGDTFSDSDQETFSLNLTDAVNATLADNQATGNITDNDIPISISISDAKVTEGNSGRTEMTFTVSLSEANGQPVLVDFLTETGTPELGNATPATDFVSRAGTLTFAPGITRLTVVVQVIGDLLEEPNEFFTLRLLNPANAVLPDDAARGDITDDDAPVPVVAAIDDIVVDEGSFGTRPATFTVTLSSPTTRTFTVDFATSDLTARSGIDYDGATNSLVFVPGAISQTISIPIRGNALDEADRRFKITLSNPVGGNLSKAEAFATIRDDDPSPTLSITDAARIEGNTGTTNATFTLQLSTASGQTITVDFATLDGTATAGADYEPVSGRLTFPPGTRTNAIVVPIRGDFLDEPNETFFVQLTNALNATISRPRGQGTITDDDTPPSLTISDASVLEGNTGQTNLTFTVRLSTPSAQTVTVAFGTREGTATAGSDFIPFNGTLTFDPGTTTRTIAVAVLGDSLFEPNETLSVILSSPQNAVISFDQGNGLILNDDAAVAAPAITRQPASLEVIVAQPAAFSVEAVGTPPLAYQWFRGETALPGATNSSFTLPTTRVEDAATYKVTVSNTAGSVTSTPATLSVITPPSFLVQPGPRTVIQGGNTLFFTVVNGTEPLHAQWNLNGAPIPGASATTLSLTGITPANEGLYTLTVTNRAGAITSNPARLTVLVPPTITQQPASLTVAPGTAATFQVAATGSSPLGYQWFFAGERVPGATNTSLTLPTTGQGNVGSYFAIVSNAAGSATSLVAQLNLVLPTNQPPTVTLTAPANGASFSVPAAIQVSATAADPDGSVARVEFFAGTTLIGSATTAPFTILWENEAVGSYTLVARATDNQGLTTTSAPVNILVTRGAAGAPVAIVRNEPSPEIVVMQNHLLELGLASQVFDQDGLTADQLRDFQLVIWHDAGKTGLTANDVSVFQVLAVDEIPLYFIGEKLATASTGLPEAQRAIWTRMTGLTPDTVTPSTSVTIDQATVHPVINGRFGTVGNLTFTTTREATRITPGSLHEVLASAGNSPALLAAESSGGFYRTVSQTFLVGAGGAASSDFAEQRKVFRNSVVWLLRKGFQALTDLSVLVDSEPLNVPTGAEFSIEWAFSHRGEVQASGVSLILPLPAGVELARAQFSQGKLDTINGVVTYTLGTMENAETVRITLTFRTSAAGTYTLTGSISGNEPDPSPFNNNATIRVTATGGVVTAPALSITSITPSSLTLRLTGQPGVRYQIESSTDLIQWTASTTVEGQASPISFPVAIPSGSPHRYYRARVQ